MEAFFTLLGTELHTFAPIYLSECFPKETVLNLGTVVMIAQFILNFRLFKEGANVCWAHVVFNFIHENSYFL